MREDDDTFMYLAAGPLAAMVLGVVLIPLRELTPASNLTFAFLAWTVVVGHLGGRWPAVATALTSALSLDFFLTRPYMQLAIDSKHDLVAFVGLALCGLVAAALGARAGETPASRREGAALDQALHQLDRDAPLEARLRAALEPLVKAFPLAAAAVRDERGRTLVSYGPVGVTDAAPPTECRIDELSSGRIRLADPPLQAGLRVRLMDRHRTIGSLDLWGVGRTARLLPAIARVLSALLALGSRPVEQAQVVLGPAEVSWTRPGRRSTE